nr:MAG TPA: hypothetical protein [Caudoviricetes sp.]
MVLLLKFLFATPSRNFSRGNFASHSLFYMEGEKLCQ